MEQLARRKRNTDVAKNEEIKFGPTKVIKRDKSLDRLPKAKLVELYKNLQKDLTELQNNYETKIASLNMEISELQVKVETKQNKSTVQTQTYPQNDIDFNCGVCINQYTSERDLWSHMDNEHDVQNEEMTNKFKCEYCEEDFEENNFLKHHIKAKHDIMTKSCKYFAQGICHFDEHTCWFSHKEFTSNNDNVKNDYTCKYCGDKFQCKNNLMKHRKQQHEKIIATCREYIKGNCIYGYNCWYKHETQKLQKYQNNGE